MSTRQDDLAFLQNPYYRVLTSLFIGLVATFTAWCIEREPQWNIFFMSWALAQVIIDIYADSRKVNFKAHILMDFGMKYIDLLTNELIAPLPNVPCIIKVLAELEVLIFDICDCCSLVDQLKYQEAKGFISDYKNDFQKHRQNALNPVNINNFITDMNKVKTTLLNR